jgi:FixJ family two-component response regulator
VSNGRPTVIVIEDDAQTRRTLERVLQRGGFEPLLYASAEDFLSAPLPSSPLGLLLDIGLTGMSGLDLQRHLKHAGSDIPIVVVTAHDDARTRAQAEHLGCAAFLCKPCSAGAVLDALDSLAPGRA